MPIKDRSVALAVKYLLIAVLLGLLLLHARVASGAEFVVSPTGDDSGAGTAASPFRSFARAAGAAWPRPSADLRLAAGSPAIDAGDPSLAPADDLEGRPRDARPDVGACEAGAASPLPFVRVVPAAAHAAGALGSLWRTDVAVVNASGAAAALEVRFTPAGGGEVRTWAGAVAAGTRLHSDVLVSLLGVPAGEKASGALRFASDRPLVVSSRTWNATERGTYGAHLAGLREERAVTPERPGVLPALKRGASSRTNVGLTNVGEVEATAAIRLFAANGTALGSARAVTVPANALVQLDDVFAACGAGDAAIAWARVEVVTPGGALLAYASVIDNATSDPTIVPVQLP